MGVRWRCVWGNAIVTTTEWFRSQAARIFQLAEEAKETGNSGIASLLTDAAARYLEQARALESAETLPKATNDGPLTLQQQQVQPGDKE